MLNKKTLMITCILTALPILVGICFWNRLPDPMATHFAINNAPDGYSSKAFAVFGLPCILLGIELLGAFVTNNDPKRKNISPKLTGFVFWLIPLVSIAASATMYAYNLGYPVNIVFYAQLIMGFLFIIIGNYLPKARQNYTIGIRIPWTLANEENWNRTHRFAGYLWVIGGVLLVIFALTGIVKAEWSIIVILLIAVIPIVYSWRLHTEKNL